MKLWGGRFTKQPDKIVEEFTSSLPLDKRLYREDIEGSLAHAKMLAAVGIITNEEADMISSGLIEILRAIENGDFAFDVANEDIHMAIESVLIENIGPTGGKLHTARSRNDQVATDMRLYLKRILARLGGQLVDLRKTLLELAQNNRDVIAPGYTHLQRAQPIFLAHHWLAYVFMFNRDCRRLVDCYRETDVMPLGSAALAGTALPIDREMVAKELGFSKISDNSMDAVGDRDFLIKFLADGATIMVHLSRLAEEIIIWSSTEFSFIELDEGFTTGSSIMPQKKNPDVAELIRGKSGRVLGNLTGLLAVLKGLPLTYNRDLQEDKTFLFDTVDTLTGCLSSMTAMLIGVRINRDRLAECAGGFSVATDFADYLVNKGVPFRAAHAVVGKIVKFCVEEGKELSGLTLEDMHLFDQRFGDDALKLVDPATSAASRHSQGGTGFDSINAQLKTAQDELAKDEKWLSGFKQ